VRPVFRVLRAVAALGGAAALVVPAVTGPAGAADQTVQVGADNENRFTPATVRIRPGDTVTWQYAGGTDHTITSTTANWDKDEPIGPPTGVLTLETSYKFDEVGTYRYICKTHQNAGMKGTVVVESRRRPSPSPTRTPTSPPPPTATSTSAPPTTTASPSVTPSPSESSATPVPPTGSSSPSSFPPPTFVQTPGATPFLGAGGITPQPATGREKGLPVLLALLLIGGVGSAELRALLGSAPRY
jgi:plastocyanin